MDGARSGLQLTPSVLTVSWGELHQLDVVVDGTSMQSLAGRDGATILSGVWPRTTGSPVDVFRGRAVDDLSGPGRLPLLVCQECADLECGVLTAELGIGDHEVTWTDFRWVNGHEDDVLAAAVAPVLRFGRDAYEAELARATTLLDALPRGFHGVRVPWWRRR